MIYFPLPVDSISNLPFLFVFQEKKAAIENSMEASVNVTDAPFLYIQFQSLFQTQRQLNNVWVLLEQRQINYKRPYLE